MLPMDEKDMELLTSVLPNVASQLRATMANVFASANRIAPPEAREKDPTLDKNASVLSMSCHQMLRLVGNLTAASELAQGAQFTLRNDDIVALCQKLCAEAEALFQSRGVTLTFVCDQSSHIIAMNAQMLERLLLNLLSNALKFTPSGGTVSVRLRVAEKNVLLSVADTGCGISADRLEHVFDRYLEVDRLDPAPHGLGLGLPLCRSIARGHGGTIVVQSAEGEGATFTVSLPNVRSAELELHDLRFDYAGGFNHVLMELSDALPSSAFLQKNLD